MHMSLWTPVKVTRFFYLSAVRKERAVPSCGHGTMKKTKTGFGVKEMGTVHFMRWLMGKGCWENGKRSDSSGNSKSWEPESAKCSYYLHKGNKFHIFDDTD